MSDTFTDLQNKVRVTFLRLQAEFRRLADGPARELAADYQQSEHWRLRRGGFTTPQGAKDFRAAAESAGKTLRRFIEVCPFEVLAESKPMFRWLAYLRHLEPAALHNSLLDVPKEARPDDPVIKTMLSSSYHLDDVAAVSARAAGYLADAVLQIKAPPAVKAEQLTDPADPASAPTIYLTNWREILITLGFRYNQEDKQNVSRLNRSYSGPIKIPGQGKQPFVEKTYLLGWWASLAAKVEESQQRKMDAKATVANGHAFGRDGEAVPDISGEIKKRRRNRTP